ncbi:MAG: ABC transporter ATP-binding protein [Synergistaceae bacterium]|nr:ABC transporter ATP-binding protein [Synergistaceae bacterium]
MIFSVENGCFGYKDRKILENIMFSVSSGQVMSVLGPNGIGKTTLLRCMMGFLKWDSGATYIDGRAFNSMRYDEIWKRIAYVPQSKNTGLSYTAEEMVLMGRTAHLRAFAQPSAADRDIALQSMEHIGILPLRDKKCNELSGGELQMVLIARAISAKPELLVLDEPESNLDFKNQIIVLETISNLSKNSGIAAIVNTHYPAHALKIADISLILTPGGKSLYGPTNEIVNEMNMCGAFDVRVLIRDFSFENQIHKSVIPISITTAEKTRIGQNA